MKFFLIIVSMCFIGCSDDPKKLCEFSNGVKAVMGRPIENCRGNDR